MANARNTMSQTVDLAEIEAASEAIPRVDATPAMKKMLEGAIRDLGAGYPFFASLASSDSIFYHVVETKKFPMLATDGIAVYFNTGDDGWFAPKWNADNRVFTLSHEILHIMREDVLWQHLYAQHGSVPVPRTPVCPDGRLPYKEDYLQMANDAIINSGLIHDRVGVPPKGIYTHPAITWETTRGEAYAIVYDEQENKGNGPGKNPGDSPNGNDPMRGDTTAPGEMGDPEGDSSDEASQPQQPHEAAQKLDQAGPERQVAMSRAQNAARQAGTEMSASEAMTKVARAPGVDWRSYIQGFLARAAGNSAYNFAKPARPPMVRELLGEQPFFMPERGGHGCNHVMVVGDVSGSIGEAEHRAILAAMVEMAGDLNPKTISVAWCCTQIHRIDMFEGTPGADMLDEFYARNPIPRGGGTSFIPPFTMLESVGQGGAAGIPASSSQDTISALVAAGTPDGLIYVTDLDGPFPADAPGYPVLWVSVDPSGRHPWGERVDINPQELL